MIIDAAQLDEGAALAADVCIVGSGAAGITLALELATTGLNVAMLTGGARRERSADRDLYRGEVEAGSSHEPLEENRRRAFGGSTIAWGGRCIPLEPIDFETRSWIPESGWPIAYSDLLPHFARAMAICDAGPFSFDARAPMIEGFDGPEITTKRLERWSPPTNFGRRYRRELDRARNVRVLMGAHALELELRADGGSIERVRAASRPGREFSIRARAVVLAAGGLENARLLLASNDVHVAGVGNGEGLVGRYYMSHLVGIAETVRIDQRGAAFRYGFETDEGGVYCRRRFALTESAQAGRGIGNAVASLVRPAISDAIHRDPLFSAGFLAKQYVDTARRAGLRGLPRALSVDRATRREHWSVVAHASPKSAAGALRVARQRYLAKRRLPMLLADRDAAQHHLFYQGEHAPNAESRVTIARARDAFGVPRLAVHVAFSDVDVRTVVELHRVIAERFDATRTGSLAFDEPRIRERVAESLSAFNSQAHHLGTTRMSSSPRTGVVDADCRVHGLDDLFVAGGSVFPTGGHANPTLTIVALAARLADHLAARFVR